MAKNQKWQEIPTILTESQFNEFVLEHLTKGSRGPSPKLSSYKIFNYILKLIHTGCQWEEIPIQKDCYGNAEIHYTRLFRIFQRWQRDGCFEQIFSNSVQCLFKNRLLDTSIIHGDGTTTAAKKGAII